jgi:hypothetical protein
VTADTLYLNGVAVLERIASSASSGPKMPRQWVHVLRPLRFRPFCLTLRTTWVNKISLSALTKSLPSNSYFSQKDAHSPCAFVGLFGVYRTVLVGRLDGPVPALRGNGLVPGVDLTPVHRLATVLLSLFCHASLRYGIEFLLTRRMSLCDPTTR